MFPRNRYLPLLLDNDVYGAVMDPLSILASTLTVCETASKVLNFIKTLRNASKEIRSLADEVTVLKAVVDSASSLRRNCKAWSSISDGHVYAFNVAISDVKLKLEKLLKTLEYCSRKGSSARLLRKQETIKTQRQGLNDAKSNLNLAIGAITL